MKSPKISFIALVALLLTCTQFSFSHASSGPVNPPAPNPEIIIDECVGECGSVASATGTANANGTHIFAASGNLCPNQAAYTVVKVNGTTIFAGTAVPGTQYSFYALKNDQIELHSYLVSGQSGVVCKRLGNLTLRVGKPF